MNKYQARALAEKGASVGALKAAVAQRRRRTQASEISRVNPSLTAHQACDIFDAALEQRDDDVVMNASSRDLLQATNVIWECVDDVALLKLLTEEKA